MEAKLASGGMGAIYRVRDPSSGGALALKRLLPNAGTAATVLFRKEYHTLVLLRHPRIIRVYDYGIDGGVPYFTMELLDGADLRALAPMSFPQACQHLRDVASSLALLHAHRILHRDVTPRNVRVTSDGRCKLLDFGALSPFGIPDTLVGTAPFIPPEALRGQPLDQRADLFALGALAYHLLTGAYAYPATSLGTLESVWRRRPVDPSTLVAAMSTGGAPLEPIPEALDDLVMSLLSLDPLARPTSAAEVIERLDAIAGRVSDPGPAAAQSYLLSAEIVGRAKEIERTKLLSARTATGVGGVLSIRHAAGAGGTRLLTEVCMEARLAGATVFQFDGEVQRGPYAVAKSLVEKLTAA
ncbi:MAG TPA: serine/threonine-protein kinase, partial [Polyangiaceae bacterium]|nr:serine/threonine-protein kinase [Polyangiaceae bacterium]